MKARIATLTATVAAAALLATAPLVTRAETSLDYDYFKAKVQPIFLTKRPDPCALRDVPRRARTTCSTCRSFPRAQAAWNEEQTRKNFDTVSKIVQAADDPLQSKILIHPLAPEAGGDVYHSGGRQFADKNDPYWKTIADWAQGAKLGK